MENTLKKYSIVVGLSLVSAVSTNLYAETADQILVFDAAGNFLILSEGRVIGEGDSFTVDDSLNASKYTVNTELKDFKDLDDDDDPPKPEPSKPDPKPDPAPEPKPTCSGPFCPGGVPFKHGEEWTSYHPDGENLQLYQVEPETIERLKLSQ